MCLVSTDVLHHLSDHEALDVLEFIFTELFGCLGTDVGDHTEHDLEEWDSELVLQKLKVLEADQDNRLSEDAVQIY